MERDEGIIRSIFAAIDEINERLPRDRGMEKSLDAPLYGVQGRLDSLALVQLIVTVEEKIAADLGKSITLADERAMAQERNPFASVQSLAAYIGTLLDGNTNG